LPQVHPPTDDEIGRVLSTCRTIAVIGLSDDPSRPAHGVSSYLKQHGYRIVPVHPKAQTVLGEKVYASLASIPEEIDMVYMFRNSDAAPAIVEETITKGAKAIWMPEGVVHEAAAERARSAGLTVIMDRCALKEHAAGRAA
jgi:predicted CoA-binding protein